MPRKKYEAVFKSQAVDRVLDKNHSIIDVAVQLDIAQSTLRRWVRDRKVAKEISERGKESEPVAKKLESIRSSEVDLAKSILQNIDDGIITISGPISSQLLACLFFLRKTICS